MSDSVSWDVEFGGKGPDPSELLSCEAEGTEPVPPSLLALRSLQLSWTCEPFTQMSHQAPGGGHLPSQPPGCPLAFPFYGRTQALASL